MKFDIMHDVVI